MATKKPAVPQDEKLDKQDFDLFDALKALDKKDYGYYDKLTIEQQKKFVPYMMVLWMSAIKGNEGLQRYYIMATNEYANKYYFNEHVQKHPKLQWMMLCAASPGVGTQFHQWIPNIKESVSRLRDPAKLKDIKEYYKKIYPKAGNDDINSVSEAFVEEHKKKCYLANKFPNMKFEDIELLVALVTDAEIEEYEHESGNG
jgi:hypothetical protein